MPLPLPRIGSALVLGVSAVIVLGCDSKSDNADSVTGPGISIHCAAQAPLGDTTVKVDCPPQP
jgi:hypothetical protein